jgi:hypothetical protein
MPTLAQPRPLRGLAALFAAVTALSLAACGGGGSDPAPSALTATISPASGALGTTQAVRVSFSASMNTSSQVFGGTLAGANVVSGWTTTAVPNDTLVVAPALPWATGAQTLEVTATDATGRTLPAPLQASYAVAAATTCGPSAGACNNAADCGFTVAQLTTATQACFIQSSADEAATSLCVVQQLSGVSAGCADCTAATATCGFVNCLAPCAASSTGAECVACVASRCAAGFVTCAGRTL